MGGDHDRGGFQSMSDLILRGGRVIDPASGRDETADVGFADGRVKAIGSSRRRGRDRRCTWASGRARADRPAAALGRQDLGSLESGAVGDATLLALVEGQFDYRNVLGESRSGRWLLNARGLVVAGRRWHPQPTR